MRGTICSVKRQDFAAAEPRPAHVRCGFRPSCACGSLPPVRSARPRRWCCFRLAPAGWWSGLEGWGRSLSMRSCRVVGFAGLMPELATLRNHVGHRAGRAVTAIAFGLIPVLLLVLIQAAIFTTVVRSAHGFLPVERRFGRDETILVDLAVPDSRKHPKQFVGNFGPVVTARGGPGRSLRRSQPGFMLIIARCAFVPSLSSWQRPSCCRWSWPR